MHVKQNVYTGQLYQLAHPWQLSIGQYVGVNGPHDTFGVVVTAKKEENGKFLHLVRGVRARAGQKPLVNL